MGNREIFASRLREIRQQTGKTQKEFADMVMSTAATISAYENSTKNPSLDIVMNIAEKCNVSIDWLCGLSEEKGLKPEVNNYKDVAIKILELLNINLFLDSFKLQVFTEYNETSMDSEYVLAIKFPRNPDLLKFFETYEDLNKLLNSKKIKQHVIDTWLEGALEELKVIPTMPDPEYFEKEPPEE